MDAVLLGGVSPESDESMGKLWFIMAETVRSGPNESVSC